MTVPVIRAKVVKIAASIFRKKIMTINEIIAFLNNEDVDYDYDIECPECANVEDDQYTCTTCWNQGGNGRISTKMIIDALIEEIEKRK